MPQSVFAKRLPGDIVINRVLQDPYVRSTIANPKFTRNFDVPYGAGPNKTKDGVVNIDRHIPQVDVVNGRRYDPARPTAIHEIVEQHIADQLQEGHAHAGDQIYEMAHHAAERAERMWVEKHLGPTAWSTYQQHWAQWLAPIEHENPQNPPPNLDKYPYPHRNVHDAPQTQETEPVFARAERRIGVAPTPRYQNGGAVAYQAGGEVDEEEPERMVAAPTLIGTSGTGTATGGGGFQPPPGYKFAPEPETTAGFQMPPGYHFADEEGAKRGFKIPPGYHFADEKRPEDEGAVGTVLRETAHEAVPLAAGVGTSVLAGAALGAPLTPLLGPVAPIAGGIIGGIAGGAATSALQEWALKKLGLSDEEQRAVNREAHPYAALAGEAALPALFARPSAFWKAGAAGTRLMESPRVQAAAGALLGGGLEAGQEAISGQDFDPKQIAAQAASMGVFSGAPTRLGRALMGPAAAAGERLGARFGGRPGEAVATEAGTEQAAAAGRQQEAADTGAGPSKTQGTASEAVEPVDGKNAGRIDQDYGKKAQDYGARTEQVQQAGEVAPDVRAAMAAAQPTEPSGVGEERARPGAEEALSAAREPARLPGEVGAPKAERTPAEGPAVTSPADLRSIFSTVSQQRGSSIVPIGDLIKESGLPIETVHEFIMGEIQAGRAMVYPSSRPYADYPKYVMDGAMKFPGQPEPFVTVTLKGPAVEPPPAAEPEGISPAKLRERIEAAYLAVTQGRKAEDVPLSKIRAQLPDLDRNTVDAGLLRILQGDATARMGKINNPRAITPEEREAAFSPGGDPLHLLWIQPSEPAAPPPKQTVGEILKARNAAARAARGEVIQGPRPGEGETAPTGEAEQRAGQRTLRVERGPVPDRADLPPERRGRVEQPPGGGGAAAPPPEPPVGGAGGGAGGEARRPPGAPMPAAPQQSFLQKLRRRYQETFDPETISANSMRAGPLFRTRGAAGAGERDRIYKNMEPDVERWNVPENEQLAFWSDVERGRPIRPEQQADARELKTLLDEAHKQEALWGSKAAYRDNYLPHEYELPKPGQLPIAEHFKSLGNTWFQKARTIDFLEEAIRAGYKPKTTNPYEAVRSRLLAGAQMRTDMELLHGLKDMGLAAIVATNRQAPALVRQGWQEVNAPDRQRWMIHPDLVPLWNNSVAAKSLWSSNTVGGEAFRTWMNIKNTVVPVKLGFTGFHVLHVGHINMSSNLTRSVWQMVAGDFDGALKSFGQGFTPYSKRGVEAREQWLLGENERTEQGKRDVKFMEWGGITPMLAEEMRQKTEQKFKESVQSMNPLKIGLSGLLKGIHAIQAPIFEQWIPHLKAADFLHNADALVTRRPELLRPENEVELKMELSAIGKSTDNRFGEMFYSNLFWKRLIKDMGIGSFLSLGWNLGFLREFGGAMLEAFTRPLGLIKAPSAERQIIHDATNKITFATIYLGTAALIGGAMTKMLSGEDPKEPYDYIFPRVGGVNPDGSPRRLNTMFYLREGPMLQKHIQEYGGGVGGILGGTGAMVWNKLLLEPIKELYQNRTYYGGEIWDTNAPAYQQVAQAMKHLAIEQVSPMAYSGAMRAKETGGGAGEQALAVLGFGPAPSYAARSALDNRIAHLYERFVAPGARPYEDEEVTHGKQVARNQLLMAKQRGDPQEIADATTAAREAGFTPKYLASLGKVDSMQKMFQRLPQQEQMAVLNQATPEELQRYWKYTSGKTKIEWRKTHPIEASP